MTEVGEHRARRCELAGFANVDTRLCCAYHLRGHILHAVNVVLYSIGLEIHTGNRYNL